MRRWQSGSTDYLPPPLGRLRVPSAASPRLSLRHRPTLPVGVPSWQERRDRPTNEESEEPFRKALLRRSTLAADFRKKRQFRGMEPVTRLCGEAVVTESRWHCVHVTAVPYAGFDARVEIPS